MWSIFKREVYDGRQQFASKDALWYKIVEVGGAI